MVKWLLKHTVGRGMERGLQLEFGRLVLVGHGAKTSGWEFRNAITLVTAKGRVWRAWNRNKWIVKRGKESNIARFQESGKNPQTACEQFEGLMVFRCAQRLLYFQRSIKHSLSEESKQRLEFTDWRFTTAVRLKCLFHSPSCYQYYLFYIKRVSQSELLFLLIFQVWAPYFSVVLRFSLWECSKGVRGVSWGWCSLYFLFIPWTRTWTRGGDFLLQL